MKNPLVLKVLSIVGTVLVLFPVGFMVAISLPQLFTGEEFLMDFLLPAELGFLVIGGAVLLLLGTWPSKPDRIRILLGIAAAAASVIFASLVAALSGLADGTIGEDSWQFYVAAGFFVLYDLSTVWMGVVGIRYVVGLFHRKTA